MNSVSNPNQNSNKFGIVLSGTICVDYYKFIDYYPNKTMLCNIINTLQYFGGAAYTVSVVLAKLETNIPINILGLIGKDYNSKLVIEDLNKYKNRISTQYLYQMDNLSTSYTDVMIENSTGNRTFFHNKGANAYLDYDHFCSVANNSNSKIFHIGYLLLLDKLDSDCDQYGLVSAKVLKMLSDKGFITSIDLVSVHDQILANKIVKHCLKYVDYLIINETEAEILTGLTIRENSSNIIKISKDNLKQAGEMLIKSGVRKYVVIHFPEGGYAVDRDIKSTFVDSLLVKESEIVNSTGAGDAFCAGVLYGLHEDINIKESLQIGNICARFNLFSNNSVDGAKSLTEVFKYLNSYK